MPRRSVAKRRGGGPVLSDRATARQAIHPSLAFGELRLGKPSESLTGEGCRAVAAQRRRRATLVVHSTIRALPSATAGEPTQKRAPRLPGSIAETACTPIVASEFHPICLFVAQASRLPTHSSVAGDRRIVYVLRNTAQVPQFYVGLTADARARLADHNMGRCPYTASRRPWRLHVVIEFVDEATAVRFERYLKSGSGRAFASRHFGA